MKMTWSPQTARRQPIRTAPSKYLTSRLRWHIERSEGTRLSEVFYPWKFLPALWQDVETDEGVVITKGTIVSAITNVVGASGMVDIASAESIPVFDDATVVGDDAVTTNIDTGYWGYPDSIVGLLVPANGGINARHPYSTLDVTLGTYAQGTNQVVTTAVLADAGLKYLNVGPNMPIGVVYNDIYQDIRGKNLNYQTFDVFGVLCDWYIEVPFVDYDDVSNFVSGIVDNQDEDVIGMSTGSCAGYLATYKKYPFFYYSSAGGSIAGAYPGQLLKSDLYGKFVPQGTAFATAATAQTVGKLIVTDSRFPKDMMDSVDTFPGSRMPGTETGGIPGHLFEFVRDAYHAINGVDPTPAQVVTQIQAGNYGIARIQLNI